MTAVWGVWYIHSQINLQCRSQFFEWIPIADSILNSLLYHFLIHRPDCNQTLCTCNSSHIRCHFPCPRKIFSSVGGICTMYKYCGGIYQHASYCVTKKVHYYINLERINQSCTSASTKLLEYFMVVLFLLFPLRQFQSSSIFCLLQSNVCIDEIL